MRTPSNVFLLFIATSISFMSLVSGQDYPYGAPPSALPSGGNQYPSANGGYPSAVAPNQLPLPAAEPDSVAAVINSMDKLDDSRRLQVGDHLSFRIVEDKSPVKTLRIMDSGEIQVPYIGLVTAKDLTAKQVAYIIKAELTREYFKEATVILTLDSRYTSRQHNRWGGHGGGYGGHRGQNGGYYVPGTDHITVFGQVGRQGKLSIPNEGSLTISTAILQSGGFARFANTKKVRIYRKIAESDKDRRVILIDVDRIMRRGDLNKDIPLKADDVIIVPEKIFNF